MPCDHTQTPTRFLFQARDYVSGDGFAIHRCPACGLALTVPTPESMARYYPIEYHGDPARRRFPGVVEALQRWLYASRARWVGREHRGNSKRILDIGCGKGFLLEAFRRQGWTAKGIEISDHAARHGREVLGLEIQVGPLEKGAFRNERFDAAVLWHVLEHSQDPSRLLGEVRDRLEPQGLLLVSVPDFNSPEARLCAQAWFHLDVPRHLVHFSRQAVSELLKETGFEIIGQLRFAPEFDLFSFVQSFLNRAGLPHNHLYRILRGRGSRLPGHIGRWWHAPATLGLSLPLGLMGLVWVPLAGWLGLGSTVTFLARNQAKGS